MLDSASLTLGFILGLAWWNIALIAGTLFFFILCVFSEVLEGSLFFLVASLGVLTFSGVIDHNTISVYEIFKYLLYYLVLGVIWSLIKYKIEVDKIIEDHSNPTLNYIKSRLSIDRISFWIIFFPISVIKFLTADLINYIILKLSSVYELIATYSLKNINIKDK